MNSPENLENRIALIGIIVEEFSATDRVNLLLHNHRQYIVGRMGVPYKPGELAVISVVIDAPTDIISALAGKLGMIPGISTKTIFSKSKKPQEVSADSIKSG